jgi:hypothetical protein
MASSRGDRIVIQGDGALGRAITDNLNMMI